MSNAVIIVAAGRGTRAAGAGSLPKQYLKVGGQPVLQRTIAAFLNHDGIKWVQTVIHADDRDLYDEVVATFPSPKLLPPVTGGENRQQSVLAGLHALLTHMPRTVLIHDAARPFVSVPVIDRVIEALATHQACLAAVPVADTLKAEAENQAIVAHTVSREGLWRAQTPQGFHFPAILAAHEAAVVAARADFTDDAAIAEWQKLDVALVLGEERNTKLTTMEDFELAEQRVAHDAEATMEMRTGTGFDVHGFEPGNHVWLCGVRIPHDHGLSGHSDADVGLHALTDAILGAIGAGDIGQHFPPSDARWKGAASAQFVAHAAGLVAACGGRIVNVDVTLICESPKIGPYREAMRSRIRAILGIAVERVSVKATTTEGLGFTGRREGIAAIAAAMVNVKAPEKG
jgi:2-C-methyl-D-erythritol 4-phosphate cytidylyltransferase / 2-C-methyl-D-erythritol 2,4-cyclodiphosphate synthase